jgi:hypothetical protein
MAETFNFDSFQISHTGVDSDTKGVKVQTRDLDMKMSNFGAMNTGARMSSDYTRTTLDFKFKNELENPTLPSFWQDAESNDNPLVLGSTVKYTRDDQFVRMGMSKSNGISINQPKFDVMDQKERMPGGLYAIIKNWPSEGWRSFGGKYDFSTEYAGGTLK